MTNADDEIILSRSTGLPLSKDACDFLRREVEYCFSKEEFLAAGAKHSNIGSRIINACLGTFDGRHPRLYTGLDLYLYGRTAFMRRKNIRTRSLEAMLKIFAHHGITDF